MESENQIRFIKSELIEEIKQENLNEIQEYNNYDLHSEFIIKEEPLESVQDLLEHGESLQEKTNDESKHFICKYCDNGFESVTQFMNHVKEHNTPGNVNYRCNLCNESFKKLSDLHNHEVVMYHFTSDFRCNVCLKYFTTKNELITHLSTIHVKLLVCPDHFKCDQCSALFLRSNDLKLHQELHKTFVCDCKRRFDTYSELLSHVEEHHQTSPDDKFYQICMPCQMLKSGTKRMICRFCNGLIFKSLRSFTKHFLRRHSEHLPDFCLNCKKRKNY